jgi:Flp pilus assembly protein TadG
MKKAIICRSQVSPSKPRRSQAGVTMILVAICMVAIIAMAALSIDVVTLYLARMEAQRTADTAALAAARVISASGITGDAITDTTSWQAICGTTGIATQAAQAVASQTVENALPTVTVNYSSQGSSSGVPDCSTLTSAFAINPTVIVQVTRSGLPTLFSRMWSRNTNSVSATAMAEAFNPSNSASIASGGEVIPVAPRCVKPWVVPNRDPLHPTSTCTGIGCQNLVNTGTGAIVKSGISLNGGGSSGVIGENFWLGLDCRTSVSGYCALRNGGTQPLENWTGVADTPPTPNLYYFPGQVGTPVTAIPSCTEGDPYEEAIEGCDAPANYQCGVQPPNNNAVDLSRNPRSTGAVANGVMCLTHQSDDTNTTSSSGQDYLSATSFGQPSAYPFQILAGNNNPLAGALKDQPITSSNSIVSLPIYDDTTPINNNGSTTTVTFVGFLQVFVNAVDQYGNINVTVLNVAGCGNNASTTLSAPGSSPVPVRLITQ